MTSCGCAGVDATKISVQDRRIGFVFQSYALFQHMSCADNISFGPRMKQLDINVDERCGCLIWELNPLHCHPPSALPIAILGVAPTSQACLCSVHYSPHHCMHPSHQVGCRATCTDAMMP